MNPHHLLLHEIIEQLLFVAPAQVKAAMTRTYNKKAMALPYAPGVAKRVRAGAGSDDGDLADDGDDDDQPEDSDPENDAFIKVPSSNSITNRIDAPVVDHAPKI